MTREPGRLGASAARQKFGPGCRAPEGARARPPGQDFCLLRGPHFSLGALRERRAARSLTRVKLLASGTSVLGAGALALLIACGNGDVRRLPPVSVALTENVAPVYDDGELSIYEAKTSLSLPIIAPSESLL